MSESPGGLNETQTACVYSWLFGSVDLFLDRAFLRCFQVMLIFLAEDSHLEKW